jgi:hypothetical protein
VYAVTSSEDEKLSIKQFFCENERMQLGGGFKFKKIDFALWRLLTDRWTYVNEA